VARLFGGRLPVERGTPLVGASNPPWKRFERELARDMGTERIPSTGARHGADFQTDMFFGQAKRRKDCLPAEVLGWLDAAHVAAAAQGEGRTPIVVIQRRGKSTKEAVVLLRWEDWRELHGVSREPILLDGPGAAVDG